MSVIQLDVVTPSGVVFSEKVNSFSFFSTKGSMGVLPGHVPVFALADVGLLTYEKNDGRDFIATMGGFIEFHNNHASFITENAEKSADIEELRAKEAKERADAELMKAAGETAASKADAVAAQHHAATRLRLLDMLKEAHRRKKGM